MPSVRRMATAMRLADGRPSREHDKIPGRCPGWSVTECIVRDMSRGVLLPTAAGRLRVSGRCCGSDEAKALAGPRERSPGNRLQKDPQHLRRYQCVAKRPVCIGMGNFEFLGARGQ